MKGRDCHFHFKEFLIQALAEIKEAGTTRKWGYQSSLTLEPHLQTYRKPELQERWGPHTQGPQALGLPLPPVPRTALWDSPWC